MYGSELILHVVKSLVCLPSIHALGFVGVVVGWTRSGVRLIDGVLRGGFVGHPVVPGEYQRIIHFNLNTVKHSGHHASSTLSGHFNTHVNI